MQNTANILTSAGNSTAPSLVGFVYDNRVSLKKGNLMEATEAKLRKLIKLQALVDKQAEDWDLWIISFASPKEKNLQKALRELHALIEE